MLFEPFGIFNPFAIHGPETVNTTYTLVYNKPGVVCQNVDSMDILITEPLDPSFASLSGNTTYCDSDAADSILVAISAFFLNVFCTFNTIASFISSNDSDVFLASLSCK